MMSIRRALISSLVPAILALLGLGAAAVWNELRDEINELYDAQLVQAAYALPDTDAQPRREKKEDDPARDLVILAWEGDQKSPKFYSGEQPSFAPLDRNGFANVRLGGQAWRCFQTSSASERGNRTILAAQPLQIRNEAALEIGVRVILPLLAVAPLVLIAVLYLVRRSLRPLSGFARELGMRTSRSLGHIDIGALPVELVPMGKAINGLLTRLSAALAAQQVFVADATHELLTPLTGLQVQVQMLERAKTDERREQVMRDVTASLGRCVTLARQLLALARHSADLMPEVRQSVRLEDVARVAVSQVLPKAHSRRIDLGVDVGEDVHVMGDERALVILLCNLVDNAVKYGAGGGRVDVEIRVRDGRAIVTVSDDGPGIPPDDHARVFDRFYRAPGADAEGSGLGLSIAREIASRHGATIELETPGRLGGLDVQVIFQDRDSDRHAQSGPHQSAVRRQQ